MVFGIERLVKRGDRWGIVYEPEEFFDLEDIVQYSVIYIACEGWWEEVDIGRVEHFAGTINGEWYEGPAARCYWWEGAVATPGAQVGEWVAVRRWDTRWWPLEAGMLIRTFGGPLYLIFPLAPEGRVVCAVWRAKGENLSRNLGRVAFELSRPPFPKEMWYYDGYEFRETELRFFSTVDDIDLTKRFFGTIDEAAWFWVFLA